MNRLYAVASEIPDHSKCGANCSLKWPSAEYFKHHPIQIRIPETIPETIPESRPIEPVLSPVLTPIIKETTTDTDTKK